MMNLFWRGVARIVSKPKVADYLIRRAMKTPFTHLPSTDNPIYMERYWLFNPYPVSSKDRPRFQFPWSIRLHWIKREDQDRAMHDHPWNARTIILKGGYQEKRLLSSDDPLAKAALGQVIDHPEMGSFDWSRAESTQHFNRIPGDTATLKHNEYHQITHVLEGTWTMFITGPWLGDWGFLVDGKKVWWRTYLGENADGTKVDPLASKSLGPMAKFFTDDGADEEPVSLFEPRPRTFWKTPTKEELEIMQTNHDKFMGRASSKDYIDNALIELAKQERDPRAGTSMRPNINGRYGKFGSIDANPLAGVTAEINIPFDEKGFGQPLIATDAPAEGSKEWADNLHQAILATSDRYQCREIGEGDWRDCTKAEYETYFKYPEMDTRVIPGEKQ